MQNINNLQHSNSTSPQLGEVAKTVRDVLNECIRVFKSNTNDKTKNAAKEIIAHIGDLFTLFMYIDTMLIRKTQNLFAPRTHRIDPDTSIINLLGDNMNIMPGLEGLDSYLHVRAECVTDEDYAYLEFQLYDKVKKEWDELDIVVTYSPKMNEMKLESLFLLTDPPKIFRDAINNWRGVGRRSTRLSAKMSEEFIGYGLVGLKLVILLQEQCNVRTLQLIDGSRRRMKNGVLEMKIMHRMHTMLQSRPFFYLDNGFEPYVKDQHYNIRRKAHEQYTEENTYDEFQDQIDELSGATDHKKRGTNFLNAPVKWLFKIPPLMNRMRYTSRRKEEMSREEYNMRHEFQVEMKKIYKNVFSKTSRQKLLKNMGLCNIGFRYKKQFRSGPHIKLEPKEMKNRNKLRGDLSDVDRKDFIEMDEWLHAVPNRIHL